MPPTPVRVPSQRPLAPSVASVTSVTNDKGDIEMITGAVHRSPGICLKVEENPGKPQLGDRLMKGLYCQSSPQMGSLSSKRGQDGRRKKRMNIQSEGVRLGNNFNTMNNQKRFKKHSVNL